MTAMIYEGVATEADGLSVKVKLNEAEMAQTKVENGLALTRMLLAQICGLSLEEDLSLADEKLDNFPVETTQASADLNEAFMNRNELRSWIWQRKSISEKNVLLWQRCCLMSL